MSALEGMIHLLLGWLLGCCNYLSSNFKTNHIPKLVDGLRTATEEVLTVAKACCSTVSSSTGRGGGREGEGVKGGRRGGRGEESGG